MNLLKGPCGTAVQILTNCLENQGNTSAASIPLALDQAIKNNDIKSGDHILMIAFGAGFSWGSVLIEY